MAAVAPSKRMSCATFHTCRIDGRLRRLQEVLVFLLEAFEGFEHKS